ncbi:MAG: cold shock and DUF1294 domain-containing protein [Acidovorax sp.]|uniref:DUF1294 domain-containing protein n=1 Tax=Acidovorax sp. TaxID=1872122 RepID=UPI0039E3713D
MQKQGTIVRWDAARAFGFIRSPGTSANVFFHIRDFRGGTPKEGLAVTYEEIHVGGKGPRAMAVQPVGAASAPRKSTPSPAPARNRREREPAANPAAGRLVLLLVAGWLALLGWGIWAGQLPLGLTLGALLAVNLLTFWVYAADKNAAKQQRWRVPENNLHLLSLLGGWPGAWLAQQSMRHKSSKREFRVVYWLTVAVHCAALAAWVTGWTTKWMQ